MKKISFLISLALIITSCKSQEHKKNVQEEVYYVCSMDPQVVSKEKGNCPICGMELVAVTAGSKLTETELELSPQQVKLGNVRAATLAETTLSSDIVLAATINFDQNKQTTQSARMAGRVDKLYYRNVGDFVKKGSPLYSIYSEELNKAKLEFVEALKSAGNAASQKSFDFGRIVQSARDRLILLGLTNAQIRELEKTKKPTLNTIFYSSSAGFITELSAIEGGYVSTGGPIVTLSALSSVWAEGQAYASLLSKIEPDAEVEVRFPDGSIPPEKGTIEFVNPELSPDTRINLVRVSLRNISKKLKPGMYANLAIKNKAQRVLGIPLDALIRDSQGAYVWLQADSNLFHREKVETGLESGDSIAVISGVKAGYKVVTSGVYLLNSEFILRNGSSVDAASAHAH